MKSNELRTSNNILDKDGEINKVIGIVNNALFLENKYDIVGCPISWCKPIPLTEEWLFKFGFKTRTTENISVQYFIGENPITGDWLFDIIWLKGDEYPFYRNGFFKIKYVHQLQNLYFALTGEELTIKTTYYAQMFKL